MQLHICSGQTWTRSEGFSFARKKLGGRGWNWGISGWARNTGAISYSVAIKINESKMALVYALRLYRAPFFILVQVNELDVHNQLSGLSEIDQWW